MNENDKEMQNMAERKEILFGKILDEMFSLYKKKNADYSSGGKSAFEESFDEFGLTSVAIRLNDKVKRIKAFAKKGSLEVDDEKIQDTLIDNAVYSILALVELEIKESYEPEFEC